MKIAVFGTGGVGGYFGGRLAQAGQEVIFIARGENLQALQRDGLRVQSFLGDVHLPSVQAFAGAAAAGAVDVVLLAVKAWQVPQAAREMRPLFGAETFVVPLQNGVEAPQQLAEVLGQGAVLGGLCRISAVLAAPGVVQHLGIEPQVVFGELDGRRTPRTERLADTFRQAGVKVDVSEDITRAMWEKFLFITAVSSVGAVTRAPMGVVRQVPETRRLLEAALAELAAVGRAQGVSLPAEVVERTIAFIDSLPPGVIPSMQRDLTEGRPSELEAQTGAVVRLARASGSPAPLHEFLYSSLLPQELQARRQLDQPPG
jgi:2-dehydropantoate 2-reductase